jgi:hypothetical protein
MARGSKRPNRSGCLSFHCVQASPSRVVPCIRMQLNQIQRALRLTPRIVSGTFNPLIDGKVHVRSRRRTVLLALIASVLLLHVLLVRPPRQQSGALHELSSNGASFLTAKAVPRANRTQPEQPCRPLGALTRSASAVGQLHGEADGVLGRPSRGGSAGLTLEADPTANHSSLGGTGRGPNVWLYSLIGADYHGTASLLRHWLRHYLRLGFHKENFVLVLNHNSSRAEAVAESRRVRSVLGEFGMAYTEWRGVYSSDAHLKVRAIRHFMHPCGWGRATCLVVPGYIDHSASPFAWPVDGCSCLW